MPRGAPYGFVRTDILNFIPETTDLSGTGALDLTSFTPGFSGEIEEFGFRVTTALAGGINIYDLVDVNNVLIVGLSLDGANGFKAFVNKKTISAFAALRAYPFTDATVLKIRRRAGGTTITAGTGNFYVRARQKGQRAV